MIIRQNQYFYDQRSSPHLYEGRNLWSNNQKIAEYISIEAEMKQAAASIKGTAFGRSDVGGVKTLQVIDSRVGITSKRYKKAAVV